MTSFADAAAFYVGLGWKVFPLAAGSKIPAIPASKGGKGFKDATVDTDLIARWQRTYPNANIGIATGAASGIIVVDIDPRNGGNISITRLAGSGLILPRVPEVRTGNGGRHLFFAFQHGIKASKDRIGKGIDLKADGGYVVGAPSAIAASAQGPGGQYRWMREPSSPELPRLPRWAVDKLTPKPRALPRFEQAVSAEGAERSLEGMACSLSRASIGHRNSLLNWAAYTAGHMVREGKIAASTVSSRLTQAALAAGLPLSEVQRTIASGLSGGIAKRGRTRE
jgi:hypothetical protein